MLRWRGLESRLGWGRRLESRLRTWARSRLRELHGRFCGRRGRLGWGQLRLESELAAEFCVFFPQIAASFRDNAELLKESGCLRLPLRCIGNVRAVGDALVDAEFAEGAEHDVFGLGDEIVDALWSGEVGAADAGGGELGVDEAEGLEDHLAEQLHLLAGAESAKGVGARGQTEDTADERLAARVLDAMVLHHFMLERLEQGQERVRRVMVLGQIQFETFQ